MIDVTTRYQRYIKAVGDEPLTVAKRRQAWLCAVLEALEPFAQMTDLQLENEGLAPQDIDAMRRLAGRD